MGRPKIKWATGWRLTGSGQPQVFGTKKAGFARAHKLTKDRDPAKVTKGFYCFEGEGKTLWLKKELVDAKKEPPQ